MAERHAGRLTLPTASGIALAGLIVAAVGVEPALAQIMIGIGTGGGGIGLGIGPPMSAPTPQYSAPAASTPGRASNKEKSPRSEKRLSKANSKANTEANTEANTKANIKANSDSQSTSYDRGVDETSFPAR